MEIKIVKNTPTKRMSRKDQDLKDMMVLLFNEGNVEEDALFLDKERVFKNRKFDHSNASLENIASAILAITSNCTRFCKEITSEHYMSINKVTDKDGNFTGIYVRFKNIRRGETA